MKFFKKDINIIVNNVYSVLYLTKADKRNKEREYILNKLQESYANKKFVVMEQLLNKFTDMNDFSSGTVIDFGTGHKTYYNIHNKNEALEKAKHDDFIDNEIIEIIPYWNFDIGIELIKNELSQLGHTY
jgi:hypothetical protein